MDEAASLDLRVLLVRGEESVVISDEMARNFVSRLPQGRLTTVARCGHNVHSQNVTGFIEAVTGFLQEAVTTPA